MKISIEELADFLKESNRNTYANKNALKAVSSRLKSEDYHFENGNLIYHDTYFGSRDFIGEEIIYKMGEPVWGANYYGYIFSEKTDEKQLYGFLRESLMQDYSGIVPVRGPKKYINENWKYVNNVKGNLDKFTGMEEIYLNEELIYRADYHGGFIT